MKSMKKIGFTLITIGIISMVLGVVYEKCFMVAGVICVLVGLACIPKFESDRQL